MTESIIDNFSLKDKNILLTGAAGILGKEIAKGYASAGANLVLFDIDQENLDSLASEIETMSPNTKFYQKVLNITDEKAVSDELKLVFQEFEKIHVLHNNAATKTSNLNDFFESYENYSLDVWKEIMDVNINAMFIMSKFIGQHMVEKGISGSIIQTSSIYGIMAPDQRIYEGSFYMGRSISTPAIYSVSKAAVVGLTNYLCSYWGEKNIRVNTLTPGGVESGQNDVFQKNYSKRVPLNRMADSSEIVSAAIFLASDASNYVNGHNLVVDGGLSVW